MGEPLGRIAHVGEPLGLIAGSGRFPFEVARAALARGLSLSVVAIEGNTDPAIEELVPDAVHWIAPGQLGRLIEFLKASKAREVILAGAIAKREMFRDLAQLRPDARAIALLSRLRDRGDDALLRAVAAEIEAEGMSVVDSTRYLEDRLTPEGVLVGAALTPALEADLRLGLRVARALGTVDVGQTVVVKGGTVLALEAIEGTDAALRRGAALGGSGVVVVKASKPGQDLRFDVPVIGAATIELAADLGVAALGLEARRTLLLERERALELAQRRGLWVGGIAAEVP
jgi:hypothetical protein